MSAWRDETAADLMDARTRLEGLAGSLSGDPTGEQLRSVWLAYLLVEKSVAFIKFDMAEENPGRVVRLRPYAVPDERQAVKFALSNLKKGESSFVNGDFVAALAQLREARNYLRALLREKRLEKNRGRRRN